MIYIVPPKDESNDYNQPHVVLKIMSYACVAGTRYPVYVELGTQALPTLQSISSHYFLELPLFCNSHPGSLFSFHLYNF